MKRYEVSIALICFACQLALIMFLGQAQDDNTHQIVLSTFSSVYVFNTDTSELVQREYSPKFRELFNPYLDTVSPSGRYRITWEETFTKGMWLTDNVNPGEIIELNLIFQGEYLNIRVEWLFNDVFAIISSGHVLDDLSLTPPLEPDQMWLVNTRTGNTSPWYWDCNRIVRIEEGGGFALSCDLEAFARELNQPQHILLYSDGVVHPQSVPHSVVFEHTSDSVPIWAFSQDMTKVSFVENIELFYGNLIILGSLSPNQGQLDRYNMIENTPIRMLFSPLGNQLAVIKTCSTYSTCIDIYDVNSYELLFTSEGLSTKGRNLATKSVYWTQDERMLFLLGNYANDHSSVLWLLETDTMQVISIWNLPSGIEHILSILNETAATN